MAERIFIGLSILIVMFCSYFLFRFFVRAYIFTYNKKTSLHIIASRGRILFIIMWLMVTIGNIFLYVKDKHIMNLLFVPLLIMFFTDFLIESVLIVSETELFINSVAVDKLEFKTNNYEDVCNLNQSSYLKVNLNKKTYLQVSCEGKKIMKGILVNI